MADSGVIRAGKAAVEVSADNTGLQAGLAAAQQRLRAFGQSVASIGGQVLTVGAVGVGAFAALGAAMVSTAGSVTHMLHEADSVGASFGFISSLSAGLQLAGGSAEGATQGIFHFNSVLAQAIGGSAQAGKAFDRLGIDADSLNDLTTDQRMDKISEAFQHLESQSERSRVAVQIFGRGGRQMLDDLSRPGGLAATRKELEGLGLVMSEETAERWKDLNKSWVMLKLSGESLMHSLLEPLIPVFQGIMEWAASAARGIRDFAKELNLGAVGNALGAGQFQLAWDTALAQLNVSWLEFRKGLMDSFPALGAAFNVIWEASAFSFRKMRDSIAAIIAIVEGFARWQSYQQITATLTVIGNMGAAEDAAALHRVMNPGDTTELDRARRRRDALVAQVNTLPDVLARENGRRRNPIEPDHIESAASGARGTFNADLAFGLASKSDPVDRAIGFFEPIAADIVRGMAERQRQNQVLIQAVKDLQRLAFQ
jgi:hypothetical protein